MYYIYGISGPSLLIESTDSMIEHLESVGVHCSFPIVTIGNKQCRGTLNGPYSIEAIFFIYLNPCLIC